ncbi:MAG: bifunctional 5,10-methylenetetrahydrofolate dehydrogenase/5,10-methenyltetrahydrofolate cyclohydrolase [Clostridiales bacterium]|nr:bifunctional 5,10-methylenetetrahydrofolate dehydrogenase/5,10-methenyltetrahydrofolate cyclohydrolase [Clostridiales bacterium]
MIRLGGKEAGDAITALLLPKIEELKAKGVVPTLGILRVGAREDDLAYERGITKKFEAAGCGVKIVELPADCSQEDLDRGFDSLNDADDVHGILVFRPLPRTLSDAYIKSAIKPSKDSDCMDIRNMAGVLSGDKNAMGPCTAEAVVRLMEHYGIETKGKKTVVVGRSLVIGRPVALMLIARDATVTVCHTKTIDLPGECRNADIIVACCGVAKTIGADYLREGQIVIDVGMNVDENGKLCGDVDYDKAAEIAEAVTPVPGGVGSVTTSVLLKHVVDSCAGA